jgi:hypothetical protein
MPHTSLNHPSEKVLPERLVDEVIAHYVGWREASAAVDQAYGNWCNALAPERAPSFEAYSVALDHEESAARLYATVIDELKRRYPGELDSTATESETSGR